MRRLTCAEREGWRAIVEQQGFSYHTTEDGRRYWNEGVLYEFSLREVELIEDATVELQSMSLAVVDRVVREGLWDRVGLPQAAAPLITASWERNDPSLYGRFDLAFTGYGVKLLEYNADTPTSLIEAAVVQWSWMRWYEGDQGPQFDQFNSLHEKLVERWKRVIPRVGLLRMGPRRLHLACMDDPEDCATLGYLMDTAAQAGIEVTDLLVSDIGWHHGDRRMVDADDAPIRQLFKLYPWENFFIDFQDKLFEPSLSEMRWVEPPWKAILASKGMLALMWEMYPDHELLLETVPATERMTGDHVRKPYFSREGSNISVHAEGRTLTTEGPYDGPAILQRYVRLPEYDGNHVVIGSWVVGDEPAGMGLRESDDLVTDNTSRFTPHVIFG